jgi:hypothetical protein
VAFNWRRRKVLLKVFVGAFLVAILLMVTGYGGAGLLIVVFLNLFQLAYVIRERPRLVAPGPFCTRCAYDLSSLPAQSPCPECGDAA